MRGQAQRRNKNLAIGAAVDRVFSTLPVELVAACHFHGEQAVPLSQLRQQAEQLGREGLTTLNSDPPARNSAFSRSRTKAKACSPREKWTPSHHEHPQGQRLGVPHRDPGRCQTGAEGRRRVAAESSFDWSTPQRSGIGRTADLAGPTRREKSPAKCRRTKTPSYVAMTRRGSIWSSPARRAAAFQGQLSSHARQARSTTALAPPIVPCLPRQRRGRDRSGASELARAHSRPAKDKRSKTSPIETNVDGLGAADGSL